MNTAVVNKKVSSIKFNEAQPPYMIHGDVQLVMRRTLPQEAQVKPTLTLVRGQGGHDHTFADKDSVVIFSVQDPDVGERIFVYVVNENGAILDNPGRHYPFIVGHGLWEYVPTMERDLFSGLIRRVVD